MGVEFEQARPTMDRETEEALRQLARQKIQELQAEEASKPEAGKRRQ